MSDALFKSASRRRTASPDGRLRSGGKAKFLLSGLLRCAECGSHYIIADARSYACGGSLDGACSNKERVRRDVAEAKLLKPIHEDLFAPERIAKMAREMQKAFTDHQQSASAKANELPAEIVALDERLARLRKRLKAGDPDLSPEDLGAAIERAEAQRRELDAVATTKGPGARILKMLPRAAEEFRRQIVLGLDGNAREAGKARVFLRELVGGKIQLKVRDGAEGHGLYADWALNSNALLRAASSAGSGGRI